MMRVFTLMLCCFRVYFLIDVRVLPRKAQCRMMTYLLSALSRDVAWYVLWLDFTIHSFQCQSWHIVIEFQGSSFPFSLNNSKSDTPASVFRRQKHVFLNPRASECLIVCHMRALDLNPNSTGASYRKVVPPAHSQASMFVHAFRPDCTSLATWLNIFVLISLKLTMGWLKFDMKYVSSEIV